jgi:hypothetical protein
MCDAACIRTRDKKRRVERAKKLLECGEEELAWDAGRQTFMDARQLLAQRIAVETRAAGVVWKRRRRWSEM